MASNIKGLGFNMTKIAFAIVIICAVLISSKSYSQGNLQFNQVISNSGNLNVNGSSVPITVPSNKVWKIESIGTPVTNGGVNFYLNGIAFPINTSVINTTGNIIWLKAGDVFYIKNYASANISFYYSILEFNIVP
jgi:hypothetical protein